MEELTKVELRRYSRHLSLQEIGKQGQEKLKNSKVILVGAGGLGSAAGLYLAAAGIGTIGIVDHDKVDESNLQRQIIHNTKEIGNPKAESAKKSLISINPNINVIAYNEELNSKNALDIIKNYDIVVDGSDNFKTRYLVNDVCVLLGKPNVYGSILKFNKEGPCYRCIFPQQPSQDSIPSCSETGVLGVLPGVIGSIQATECIKLILDKGNNLSGRLLVYDALLMTFDELKIKKNINCPICGENRSITEPENIEQGCNEVEQNADEITVQQLKKMMDDKEDFVLLDVRENFERDICTIKDSLHIPMNKLETEFEILDKNKNLVVYCHHGVRSLHSANFLKSRGYSKAKSLIGGINEWSSEIEPETTAY